METLDASYESDDGGDSDWETVDECHEANDFYQLDDLEVQNIRRFNTEGRSYRMRFQNLDELDLEHRLVEIFDSALNNTLLKDVKSTGLVGLQISHPVLKKP